MATHTTSTGKVKVGLALDPHTYELLQAMAPGPRSVGALLDDLIRAEAARRENASRAQTPDQDLELAACQQAQDGLADAVQQLQRQSERVRILHEIDQAILAARAPGAIAGVAAEGLLRVTGVARVVVAIWHPAADRFEVLAWAGLAHPHLKAGTSMAFQPWPWLAQVGQGQAAFDDDLLQHPDPTPEGELSSSQGIRSHVAIPLMIGGEPIGHLDISRLVTGRLPDEDLALAQQTADSLAVAIHHTRLDAEVQDRRRQLQALSRQLVQVQEQERRALSRELHDTSGQNITALKLGLSSLKRAEGCSESTRVSIDGLLQVADTISEDLHRLAVDLRPVSLDRYGLVPALEQLLTEFRKKTGVEVDCLARGMEGERLPADTETALYRIVQEAITNCARYAQATRVSVIILRAGDNVQLLVEDDGRGFDVAEGLRRGRLGLLGMRERAEMLGGTLEIESSPSYGVCISVTVPARQAQASGAVPDRTDDAWPIFAMPAPEETHTHAGAREAAEPDALLAEAAELARAKALSDALVEIMAATTRSSTADGILRLVLAHSAEAIGRDNAHIALREGDRWELRYGYREGLERRTFRDPDAPVFVWVERTRQVLVVNDTRAAELDDALRLTGLGLKSYASIPLLAGEKVLGVLTFANYSVAAPFHPSEVDFLNRLAGLVALALDNAQLREIETRQRDELAQRVEELQTLFDLVPLGIAIARDPECRRIDANPANARMLGISTNANASVSAEEHEGAAPFRVYQDGRDVPANQLPMQVAAGGLEVRDMYLDVLRADGQTVTMLAFAVPLFDAGGKPRGAIGAFVDLTAQRLAQAEADERANRQRVLQVGVNRILETALTCATEEELGRAALTVCEQVTGSKFGLLGELNAQGCWDDIAVSDPGWEQCRIEDPAGHGKLPHDRPVHGIYERVLLDGKAFFTNDPASHPDSVGTPPGHPPLTAFLGVPLTSRGKTIGLIGLGNREGGYRPDDLETAEVLAAVIVEALSRKRVAEELREHHERLGRLAAERQAILDAIPDGLVIDDPQGRIVSMNAVAEEMLGYSPETRGLPIAERSASELQPLKPDGSPFALQEYPAMRALRGEVVRNQEMILHVPARSGGGLRVSVSSAPIRAQDGAVTGCVTTFSNTEAYHEVSEQLRRANAQLQTHADALREAAEGLERRVQERTAELEAANAHLSEAHRAASQSEAQLRYQATLLANVNDAIMATDTNLRITAWNHAAEKQYGWKAAEVMGANVLEVTRSQFGAEQRGAANRMVLETGHWRGEVTHHRRDGTPILTEGTTVVLRDAAGGTTGYVSVHRDITERKRAEEALRLQKERLEILHQIYRSILAARAPGEIARAATDRMQQAMGAMRVGTALFNFATQEAGILAIAGWDSPQPAVGSHWPLSSGWMIDEILAGRVATVPDVAALPDSDTFKASRLQQGVRSAVMVPMLVGDQVIGQLTINRAEPGMFPAQIIELATQVADSLALAIHNARLHEQLQAGQAQLQALSHRLVEMQERERTYVADRLYNEAAQVLAALKMQMGMLGRDIKRLPDSTDCLAEMTEKMDWVLRELHHLAGSLRPAILDQLGLAAALQQYLNEFGRQHGLVVACMASDLKHVRLPGEVETTLYRLAQEALANVAAHARARRVDVTLTRAGAMLLLVVQDDGLGFDVQAALRRGALGLAGMRERAEALGGSLEIESTPGLGTTLIVEVPFDDTAAAE